MNIYLELLIIEINYSPTFYKIIKNKDVEEFKPDPYIATVLNCAFWVFYGLPFVHPNSLLVVTINGVGLVFEFVYLTIFYMYANNKGRVISCFHYSYRNNFSSIAHYYISFLSNFRRSCFFFYSLRLFSLLLLFL